jgi:hypothetical protein
MKILSQGQTTCRLHNKSLRDYNKISSTQEPLFVAGSWSHSPQNRFSGAIYMCRSHVAFPSRIILTLFDSLNPNTNNMKSAAAVTGLGACGYALFRTISYFLRDCLARFQGDKKYTNRYVLKGKEREMCWLEFFHVSTLYGAQLSRL